MRVNIRSQQTWKHPVLILILLICTTICSYGRQDRNLPHRHQGLLKSYQPGPFKNVRLSGSDEAKLSAGIPVTKQSQDDPSGGGAICIQDINAPKAAVWNQILELDAYKGKVSKVTESKNYKVSHNNLEGSYTIKTKMIIGVLPGYSYENYYYHRFYPKKDSMTWTLDYEKTSDFDDVAGHWHLQEHPSRPGVTRVYYACDIKLHGSVPGPILNYLSKAALKQATGWVKKESERNPTATKVAQKHSYSVPRSVVKTGTATARPRFGNVFGRSST